MGKHYTLANRPKLAKHIRHIEIFNELNRLLPPPPKCSPVETLYIPEVNLPVMESQNFYDTIMVLIDISKGTRYAADSTGMYKFSLTLTLMVKQLIDARKKNLATAPSSFVTEMYIEAIRILRDYMAVAHSVVSFPINYCECAEGITVELGDTCLTFLTAKTRDSKAFMEKVFEYAYKYDDNSGKNWPKIYYVATIRSIIRLASLYPSDLDCFREMATYAMKSRRKSDFIYREAETGWYIDFLTMPRFLASKTAISNARERNRNRNYS